MNRVQERVAAVDGTMQRIREHAQGRPVTRALLTELAALLDGLARQPELFGSDDFPAPEPGGKGVVRYLLSSQPDDSFALYLNSINPGMSAPPHNHTTWAVIVALDGEELNRVYERVDDGANPAHAELRPVREFTVGRGRSIQFLGDDIHSIHITGDRPTRHFHLYGRALEVLDERLGFDPDTGKVVPFNKNYMDAPRAMPR